MVTLGTTSILLYLGKYSFRMQQLVTALCVIWLITFWFGAHDLPVIQGMILPKVPTWPEFLGLYTKISSLIFLEWISIYFYFFKKYISIFFLSKYNYSKGRPTKMMQDSLVYNAVLGGIDPNIPPFPPKTFKEAYTSSHKMVTIIFLIILYMPLP